MKYEVSAERSGEIAARCPVCGMIVPFAYVNVKQYGFLRRRVSVVLEGRDRLRGASVDSSRTRQFGHLGRLSGNIGFRLAFRMTDP